MFCDIQMERKTNIPAGFWGRIIPLVLAFSLSIPIGGTLYEFRKHFGSYRVEWLKLPSSPACKLVYHYPTREFTLSLRTIVFPVPLRYHFSLIHFAQKINITLNCLETKRWSILLIQLFPFNKVHHDKDEFDSSCFESAFS